MIQGDISELTVDAVVHPTNNNFHLGGQCGELEISKYDMDGLRIVV